MTRIGLISDTHNYLDDAVFKYFEECDEIWHAGDFGTIELADKLVRFKPSKGVFGKYRWKRYSECLPVSPQILFRRPIGARNN